MTYRNVVVGTDGSPTAERAVRHAADLARRCDGRLVIVTAYQGDPDQESRRLGDVPSDLQWSLTDRAQADRIAATGRRVARDAGAGEVVLRAEEGRPADTILAAAREFDADVIVVGSVGMTSHARFLLGSVANDISHHAPCDVLIVETVSS